MAEEHQVKCTRCGEKGPGLPRPPLAGEIGQLVYDNVCRSCWGEWFEQSVGVINHYGLNPAIREDRQQLYEVMREYLVLPGKA
ncbi:MAG TPA: Fe(2+)-trafficking protein [Chloroflexota bacterium]|nr:Fe(2+)-trafficking protein [Chloroflexota bacterium]